MGVGKGTGVVKAGEVKSGFGKKLASGVTISVLTLSFAACSTSKGPSVAANVTLQKAIDDYTAGNVTLAKSEFQQVVKTNPSDKYAWYNLGVIAQYAGSASEASTDYQQSLAIDPHFESPLFNYGLLKLTQNDLDSAIGYLGRAVVETPKDANAHWQLGLALAKRGKGKADNDRSTKELNTALKLDPSLIKSLGAPKSTATTTSTP
jgi:Tfp pilus assembly protein PilF